MDIYHWMSAGTSTYNVETGNDLADVLTGLHPGTPNGTERVDDLMSLANEVYSTLKPRVDSAAFQLVVWAITYGAADANGLYQFASTNPGFKVDANTAVSQYVALANDWLANLDTAAFTGNCALTYLSDAGATRRTQNRVVFTPVYSSAAIPSSTVSEPGALMLILFGFALLAATTACGYGPGGKVPVRVRILA